MRDRVREAAGRDPEPTAGVIDAQSVKAAASVPAAGRGFDGLENPGQAALLPAGRATAIVQAVLVLHHVESPRYEG
ncbi:hypothetical protein [Streptomyces sp. Isolate_45]|uniref:hypothetical protein n=1 Tax=Streptomyces sp. Isolate_45 TaxID=2950111 RepID=UPI002481C6CC|nr:hypothetical protein [Streptomyces sp. Isolate_45]MDA5280026.1 hypothetical protein [Streptomyces sp. Isolate_45]